MPSVAHPLEPGLFYLYLSNHRAGVQLSLVVGAAFLYARYYLYGWPEDEILQVFVVLLAAAALLIPYNNS